ncbi:MAG: DUF1491 family protein [Sphingomicrobium sp.]
MSEARINAAVEASALVRKVQTSGDFATILRKGDSERGALLLIISNRGHHFGCLQRQLNLSSGNYSWIPVGPERSASSIDLGRFLADQARFDPDLWQIELDVASPERFVAETTASG